MIDETDEIGNTVKNAMPGYFPRLYFLFHFIIFPVLKLSLTSRDSQEVNLT